jgi:hypothetical protein
MLQDINRILNFLKSSDGKKIQNRIFIIILIVFALLMINRYYLISFVSDDYKITYNQSKLLFKNGISPYGSESQSYLAGLAENEAWEIKNANTDMENPIFQLIFYFPFTLIQNYQWSEAVFVTINQICVLLSIHMLFNLIKWDPKIIERYIVYLLSSTVFFVTINLMSTNISVFQLVFLVGALFFDEKGKPILSGIFFGFSLIDPISMFYMLTTLSIILISTKKITSLIWAFITVSLMTLFSFIFDGNWVLGWLKSLFLIPKRYPFVSFLDAAYLKYNLQFNRIFAVVPILLISWVIFEIIRTPKDTIDKKIWLLSITGIVNHYLMVQSSPNSEILFLLSLILLIGIWWDKINQIIKIGLYVILGILSYSVFKWPLFNLNSNNESILFFLGLFFIINLYWVRIWVMKPFVVNGEDKK